MADITNQHVLLLGNPLEDIPKMAEAILEEEFEWPLLLASWAVFIFHQPQIHGIPARPPDKHFDSSSFTSWVNQNYFDTDLPMISTTGLHACISLSGPSKPVGRPEKAA
jgi:hypothetical protein